VKSGLLKSFESAVEPFAAPDSNRVLEREEFTHEGRNSSTSGREKFNAFLLKCCGAEEESGMKQIHDMY